MHILLTRPFDDCRELILRFKSLGHIVSHIPVISIQRLHMKLQIFPNLKELYLQVLTLLNF